MDVVVIKTIKEVIEHCYFNKETGQLHCSTSDCLVYIDIQRNYAYCKTHGNIINKN